MSLFSRLSVSESGMTAQRARAELLVENLANAETTRTPEGGPYRRKDAVFESAPADTPFSRSLKSQLGTANGVRMSRSGQWTTAIPRSATCPGIRTRTKTVTWRFRESIRPRTWWT